MVNRSAAALRHESNFHKTRDGSVVGAELRSAIGTRTAEAFNRLADRFSVVELPADFSSHDAGEAGHQLLEQIRAIMSTGGRLRS